MSRKGAIDASAGTPGLIPGSMGTRSYVVTGKGSRLALNSSPHGAGREYSRKPPGRRSAGPSSRRPWRASSGAGPARSSTRSRLPTRTIDVVMDDAKDLVEIRHTLRQIVNVKGD